MATFTSSVFKTKNTAVRFKFTMTESYSTSTGKRLLLKLSVMKTSDKTIKTEAPAYVTWKVNDVSQGKLYLGNVTIPCDDKWREIAKSEKYVTLANNATSVKITAVFDIPKAETVGSGNTGSHSINLTKYTVSYAKQSGVTGTVPSAQIGCFYNST